MLVAKILAQKPANNFTNTGTLEIRNENGDRTSVAVSCETILTETNWFNRYHASATGVTTLVAIHNGAEANHYLLFKNGGKTPEEITGNGGMIPFAGSDFWVADLGLEFFHWPQQKIVKKEFHRQCPCTVLESTNPNPGPGAYSKVQCWIDNDSLGIVEANAYDAAGKKLKNFYPKNLQKVNGQYQVESMVMENLQTGAKSVLEFDLDK